MKIPLSNPLSQYQAQQMEIDQAIQDTLRGGNYILGPQVAAFEKEFAQYIGTNHAIGVANGTDALQLALMGCGIGHNDEVITVSHTAVATVAAIEMTGATPVLVDVEPDTFCIDTKKIELALTPKTKAVVAVHLYGQPCDLSSLQKICLRHGLKLIEDCAQAHGATYNGKRVGTFGDAASFSFYPTKNLGAIGDGGMVVTSNSAVADKINLLRQYGWKERYQSSIAGMNSRLDELQAAVLRVKLKNLDKSNEARRKLASLYTECLTGSEYFVPQERPNCSHVYHLYVIQAMNRDNLQERMQAAGVGVGIHYPVPVHQQAAYRMRIKCVGGMQNTERLSKSILSLPMYPELKMSDAERVTEEILANESSVKEAA